MPTRHIPGDGLDGRFGNAVHRIGARPHHLFPLARIRDGVGFHADTVANLRESFHEAVEDYIETCAKIGKPPQKAFSGQVMFRVKPEVHRKAALAAELSGMSLNQWAEDVLDRAAEDLTSGPGSA